MLEGKGAFGGARGRATLLLISLRVAYAYNWFDIGPALPTLSVQFGVTPGAWGVLVAAFLLGAGVFQVPAGLLARRHGTRSVTLWGAALLGVAALLSALAPNYLLLVAFRFAAGAGAGLFFSPAIALVGELYPPGERGVPVGMFSSAFSAGAGLGVFAPALLIPSFGWPLPLALGGAALLLLALPAAGAVPPSVGGARPADGPAPRIPSALRARGVWVIGLAFIGLEGASLSAGQYFVPFGESIRGWSPALAGAVGSLLVFPSVFGGPPGGRLAERFTNRRTQLVLATAVPAALLILLPEAGLGATIAIATAFSFSYGMVYAMMYVLAAFLPGVPPREVSLAIGLFNGLQLSGGAAVAYLIGVTIGRFGYPPAWELLGLLVLVPLALLAGLPRTGRRPNDDPGPVNAPDLPRTPGSPEARGGGRDGL